MTFNKISSQGVAELLEVTVAGVSAFTGCVVKAMFLGPGTTIADNWDDVAVLSDGTFTLDEFTSGLGSTYYRQTVGSIIINASNGVVSFTGDPIVWLALPQGGVDIERVLLYIEKDAVVDPDSSGGLDLRVPLALMDLVFTPDGTDITVNPSATGFFSLNVYGC